jgi:ABC-type taurine transport system substrate-binding protein
MSAMKEELLTIVEAIDWVFGEGYAKKNPELVGRMLQSNAVSYASYQISEAISPSDEEDEEIPL